MLRPSRSKGSDSECDVVLFILWLLIASWTIPTRSEAGIQRQQHANTNESSIKVQWGNENAGNDTDIDLDLDSLEFDDDDEFFRDDDQAGDGTEAEEYVDDEYESDIDLPGGEAEDGKESQSTGLLPSIYGMLRNTFNFGGARPANNDDNADATKDEEFYDDDEKADEFLDYNNLEENSEEKKFLAGNGRGFFGMSNPSANNSDDLGSYAGRQFFPMPMYMLQGIYLVEPRLNHYIDGVVRNLGSEIKVSGIDPLYYRVLPKGRVASRMGGPRRGVAVKGGKGKRRRRRKGNRNRNRNNRNRRRRRRRRPFFGRSFGGRIRRRRNQNRNKRRKPAASRAKPKAGRNRIAGKNVGLGRVDGLSNLSRDGPTEMQSQTADGNYTLVRSHFTMGPLDITMQFRTVRGVKRAATTLHKVKIHTVTRVSNDGSEMMDFYLDRPHPETIRVRGKLFPMAERIARNIFSRLFANDSFLVARIREKTSMALLSKPTPSSAG